MVTVRGAPIAPCKAMTGYPCVVQVEVPPFVTVTNPVMVPAAPCPWDATAVMLLHPEAAAVLDVVEELAEDVVVDAEELVAAARCVVVVDGCGDEGLEHAARVKLTPAVNASARRRVFTPRSPPAGRTRGPV